MRTTVGIIGAGPAGLLLARLLHNAGIDSVVLESRDRAYVEQRQRAGILEQGRWTCCGPPGPAGGWTEGLRHDGIELRFARERHRVDFPALTGGSSVMVYAQTEVCKDLIALQLEEGGPLLFGAEALAVEGRRASGRGSASGTRARGRAGVRLRRRLRRVLGWPGGRYPPSTPVYSNGRTPSAGSGSSRTCRPPTTNWSTPATTAASPCSACARPSSPGSTSRCPRVRTPVRGRTRRSGTSWSGA